MRINELILDLKDFKKKFGDLEICTVNKQEEVFDIIDKSFLMISASKDEKFVCLLPGKDYLKV